MRISYSLKNLRSLDETDYVSLRPITILLGRNSAGKSTFLRSFPLFRQSIEARTSGPILWYGDYVDFGDFKAAVRDGEAEREIEFGFKVEDFESRSLIEEYVPSISDYNYYSTRRIPIKYEEVTVNYSIGLQNNRTVRRRINIKVPEKNVDLQIFMSRSGVVCESYRVNGIDIGAIIPGHEVYFRTSSVFSSTVLALSRRGETGQRRIVNAPTACVNAIKSIISESVDKRILPENVLLEARKILMCSQLNKSSIANLESRADTESFRKLYRRWVRGGEGDVLEGVKLICALHHSLLAINGVGSTLAEFFRGTTYLGPARARSERYYRFQELEISEIAPDGQNLPMFLASIGRRQLGEFSDWVKSLFDFGVEVERNEGHISIKLINNGLSVNLSDTGYGVSQILPVLAQVWWASRGAVRRPVRSSMSELRPITMEQPELHLHPAHQARLADVFLSALTLSENEGGGAPLFLIETHSEALINRLGELVGRGDLNADDIQIVIFSSSSSGGSSSSIRTSVFSEGGVLENWPYGFFNY
ncbi:AAA family ATPase [Amorphus sp. MBR-141]